MTNKTDTAPPAAAYPASSLPAPARLPINRCNVPPSVLGGLHFQSHPIPLQLDGVAVLHRDLFDSLARLASAPERAQRFMDYMTVHFRLEHLEDAGYRPDAAGARPKADYLRVLRGWLFDADGREAAVLKGWTESRFGLLTRHHREALGDYTGAAYDAYLSDRAMGLYNTNALEAQLDLLYSYCQYELRQSRPEAEILTLYRGVNRLAEFDVLAESGPNRATVLLNNVNSFTASPERAGEFGDRILRVHVPATKIFYFAGLLPNRLQGESEYIVIGGVYDVETIDAAM